MKTQDLTLRIFVIIAVCLFIGCNSTKQSKTEHPTPFEFTLIDSVDGTKADLYVKAQTWFIKRFESSKSVIQLGDKEAGRIIGKAFMTCTINTLLVPRTDFMNYLITIDCKDGKYRCVLSDFYHEAGAQKDGIGHSYGDLNPPHVKYGDPEYHGIKNVAANKSKMILDDFRGFMKSKEKNF